MYTGRFESERETPAKHAGKRNPKRPGGRLAAMTVATVLLLALTVGGTVAWLTSKTNDITNTFTPSKVTCRVDESFNETTGVKSNVKVTNTGDTTAFIRVKLVTYRTNDAGEHIGGTADLPGFTNGDWISYGGYYYYKLPVAPENQTANLINSVTLTKTYNDADGGHQAIDVMAEAIQSQPEAAVSEAWGEEFSIDKDGNLVISTN